MQIIIMAGGKGERMESLFPSLPKALFPLAQGTIIDRLVSSMNAAGATEIIVCCGHLAEKIESHYLARQTKIRIIKENKSLGTAGALELIKDSLQENFLVVNCDILVDLDFADFFQTHVESQAASTIAIKKFEQPLDYGLVILSNQNEVNRVVEKPSLSHPILIGIYAFRRKLVEHFLVADSKLDMPDFLNQIITHSGPVKSYQYSGRWLDLGTPSDYERVANLEL